MVNIGLIISNAIKEGKWLQINYLNKDEQQTYFWCSILDIDITRKILIINMFNHFIAEDILEKRSIYFERIIKAKVIEGTTYDVPSHLIEKIESNLSDLTWLKFDSFNNNILLYLKDCHRYDNDPYQRKYDLIDGVDLNELSKRRRYQLNNIQMGQIIDNIYQSELNNNDKYHFQQLALNRLSIAVGEKLYVVAYQNVLLDIYARCLILKEDIQINKHFLIDGKRHSLSQYLDIDPNDFEKNIETRFDEYKEMLQLNLNRSELLDEKPFLMIIERNFIINIDETYQEITRARERKVLSTPLKAFFGNNTVKSLRDKESTICFIDNRFNIDQLRVVYNALKNPITYVQGPPGTGKTTTILNIVLSAFINDKTVLIVSNNNKPVDDLYDKIVFYHDKRQVPFPILRLGKKEENLKALKKIKDLYDKSQTVKIKQERLDFIKDQSVDQFKELNILLTKYEKRLELEEKQDVLKNLLQNTSTVMKKQISSQLKQYQEEYEQIDKISDEEVAKFPFIASNNYGFMQYLYYRSFKYIKLLNRNEYKELVAIINLPDQLVSDQDIKEKAFKDYLANGENMTKFLKVFPFIATTNQSSYRLGPPQKFFDIGVMDEAGQCNIATSLIPITRCKNLVLVGDQNQLQPVIVLEENLNKKLMNKYKISPVYDYCNNSILKLMMAKDKVSPFILLSYHYRCSRPIIQFSNKRYYDNKLKINDILDRELSSNQLEFASVKSTRHQELRNTSFQEAYAIAEMIKKNNYQDIGIITPFRNQATLIRKVLNDQGINNVDVGTIHTFQGDEKNVIILSSAITQAIADKTYSWVKNNREMINVAVTRAKDKLIMVGDFDEIEKKSANSDDDLVALARYVKSKGEYNVIPSKTSEAMGLKSYDTHKEAAFFETIGHLTTVIKELTVKSKVKVSTVFSELPVKHRDFFFKGEFDFVIYNKETALPVLIFEIDGSEHINDEKTINNDRKKELICTMNNIKIIRIPNNFVKRYEYVKELLLKFL